ncbi:MAG: hypothetical protein HYU97_00905 [Deltaproteobacteria bacterium]|nr:hypothetical protein [Deltaproteobacteria bacterium]
MKTFILFFIFCSLVLVGVVSMAEEEQRGDPQPQDIVNPKIWPENGPIYVVIASNPGGVVPRRAIVRQVAGQPILNRGSDCVLPEELEERVVPFCKVGDEEIKDYGLYYKNRGSYVKCVSVMNSNQLLNDRQLAVPQALFSVKTCLRIQQAVRETWE